MSSALPGVLFSQVNRLARHVRRERFKTGKVKSVVTHARRIRTQVGMGRLRAPTVPRSPQQTARVLHPPQHACATKDGYGRAMHASNALPEVLFFQANHLAQSAQQDGTRMRKARHVACFAPSTRLHK